jgi:hypothetical protein
MAHPTKDAAVDRAHALAVKRQESMYVVWCGDGYAVADEFDLDTWWQGATVLGEVQPDGTFVHAE